MCIILIIVFYVAPSSTEIALRRLMFKTQLKHILSVFNMVCQLVPSLAADALKDLSPHIAVRLLGTLRSE